MIQYNTIQPNTDSYRSQGTIDPQHIALTFHACVCYALLSGQSSSPLLHLRCLQPNCGSSASLIRYAEGNIQRQRRKEKPLISSVLQHNKRPGEGFTLPKGDILVHAGDLTNQGSLSELRKAFEWISEADFPVKIVVAGTSQPHGESWPTLTMIMVTIGAGNHDLSMDPDFMRKQGGVPASKEDIINASKQLLDSHPAIYYLQHTGAVIPVRGKEVSLRVFGSPYSPSRGTQDWAFQYEENEAEAIWSVLPDRLDLLVTHTPPAGHCDASDFWQDGGCAALTDTLSRVRPLLHVCGHCHGGRGAVVLSWDEERGESCKTWKDPGAGNRKQSLLDLTGRSADIKALRRGRQTAVANASIMAQSHSVGRSNRFHKPIVVDIDIIAETSDSKLDSE